jgi:hypothetical protein
MTKYFYFLYVSDTLLMTNDYLLLIMHFVVLSTVQLVEVKQIRCLKYCTACRS